MLVAVRCCRSIWGLKNPRADQLVAAFKTICWIKVFILKVLSHVMNSTEKIVKPDPAPECVSLRMLNASAPTKVLTLENIVPDCLRRTQIFLFV